MCACVRVCVEYTPSPSPVRNGGECVKVYLHHGVMRLSEWFTSNGLSGLLLATQVAVHLLNSGLAECSALFVGRLVVMLIKQMRVALCGCGCVCVCVCFLMCHMTAPPQVGSLLGDHLESIVCSLLSKLHSVVTFMLVQSLLMVLCTSCSLSSAGGHPLLPGADPLHQWSNTSQLLGGSSLFGR